MSSENDWLTDAKFTVRTPESIRRRKFWVRVYFVTAALSLLAGAFGCFFLS